MKPNECIDFYLCICLFVLDSGLHRVLSRGMSAGRAAAEQPCSVPCGGDLIEHSAAGASAAAIVRLIAWKNGPKPPPSPTFTPSLVGSGVPRAALTNSVCSTASKAYRYF